MRHRIGPHQHRCVLDLVARLRLYTEESRGLLFEWKSLGFLSPYRTGQLKVSLEKALKIIMHHLTYPCHLVDLAVIFGRSIAGLSSRFNVMIKLLFGKLSFLFRFHGEIFPVHKMEGWATAIQIIVVHCYTVSAHLRVPLEWHADRFTIKTCSTQASTLLEGCVFRTSRPQMDSIESVSAPSLETRTTIWCWPSLRCSKSSWDIQCLWLSAVTSTCRGTLLIVSYPKRDITEA